MIRKVEALLKENGVALSKRRLLLAVSGGADSMAMLHLFYHNRDVFLCDELIVCHFNHGLRGKESDDDEELVREYCESLSIPFIVGRARMSDEKKPKGHSVESWGRELRYLFLGKQIRCDSDRILTAHTKNDQAETVLFHLSRGAGIRGAVGIPVVNKEIVRPLLGVERRDVEQYCQKHNIPYHVDRTNVSIDYSRNRIRHNVLPELELINKETVSHITAFSWRAFEADRYLSGVAKSMLKHIETGNGVFSVAEFLQADALIQKYAVKLLLEAYGIEFSEKKLTDMIKCIMNERGMRLSAVYRMDCNYGEFSMCREQQQATMFPEYAIPLSPGDIRLPGGDRLFIEIYDIINGIKIKNEETSYENLLDYDKMKDSLVFRSRKQGDLFTSARRGNTKKIKKLFNEMKLPPEERNHYPLLADCHGIVWVKGEGAADRAVVSEDTKRVLSIKILPEK